MPVSVREENKTLNYRRRRRETALQGRHPHPIEGIGRKLRKRDVKCRLVPQSGGRMKSKLNRDNSDTVDPNSALTFRR